ncbi:MAG: MOSC domain-containing protein [Pirellula sp.]
MGTVIAVSTSSTHSFSKINRSAVELVAGMGVDGDAHCGSTVQHRSRIAQDPSQPNLRQVHLIHSELFDELLVKGFVVHPGQIGENITTRGIQLLALPQGTVLAIGDSARVELTGLRNPCKQLNGFQQGLMEAVLDQDDSGNLVRKSGVMGIVVTSGRVRPSDLIQVVLPPEPHFKLERV